jgi:hypothetical protein
MQLWGKHVPGPVPRQTEPAFFIKKSLCQKAFDGVKVNAMAASFLPWKKWCVYRSNRAKIKIAGILALKIQGGYKRVVLGGLIVRGCRTGQCLGNG